MKAIRRQQGQVLIIIFGAILLGGGLAAGALSSGTALKAMKKEIKALELDENREEQALDILDRWKKAVKPVMKTHSKRSDEVIKLLDEQHTSSAALTGLLSRQTIEMQDAEDQVLMIRDELRTVLRKDEWQRLFARD
jgi:hypothetical protein